METLFCKLQKKLTFLFWNLFLIRNKPVLKKSEENKKWINDIVEVMAQFGNLAFQKKGWVEGKTKAIVSFNESICMLYDDLHFLSFLKNDLSQFRLKNSLIKKMKLFDSLIDKCIELHGVFDEPNMILDPEWHKVVYLTQKILKDFELLGFFAPDLSQPPYDFSSHSR